MLSVLSPPRQSRQRAAGKKGHPKKRGQRATSNIFAMFDQAQIQEFKEVRVGRGGGGARLAGTRSMVFSVMLCVLQAFNMIDQNRDGFIDNEDLKDMLASLGVCVFVFVL